VHAKIFRYLASYGPPAVANLVGLVPPSRMDVPTHDGRFTPREIVCHLVDSDLWLQDWIRQSVDRPGSSITVEDAVLVSLAKGYSHSDPTERLLAFAEARETTCRLVEGLDEEAMDSWVNCPFRGKVSVREQLTFILGHDVFHLEQLSAVLKDAG
jgi:hypothetical protein